MPAMQTWIMLNVPTPTSPEPASPEPARTAPAGTESASTESASTESASTEPTQLQLRSAAATFALLGSAPRLHLAWLMAHETSDVGTLARRVGLSIPTTSQHLAKLRLAGIVSARREGRHTYYTIEDPHVLTMLDQIFGHIAPDGTLAPDPK
jgi:DNA-binding transcriptional ArsR family regulator